MIAASFFNGLAGWGHGVSYDVAFWPIIVAFFVVIAVGIIVLLLAILGIRKLLRHRKNRLKNG